MKIIKAFAVLLAAGLLTACSRVEYSGAVQIVTTASQTEKITFTDAEETTIEEFETTEVTMEEATVPTAEEVKPEPTEVVVTTEPPETEPPFVITTPSAIDGSASDNRAVTDWPLFVVSEGNPLPTNYSFGTKKVFGARELDSRCADYAINMINAALNDGIELNVTSGYRSIKKQQENIKYYIEVYMSYGYSYDEALAQTYRVVAPPGSSEHNAGVAMDIVTEDWFMSHTELTTDFDTTKEFDWLQENSWKYGFIMSFPKDKESITGYAYEPWHYRYVGLDAAKEIHDLGGITLNEYLS